eukprot:gene27506-2508_t
MDRVPVRLASQALRDSPSGTETPEQQAFEALVSRRGNPPVQDAFRQTADRTSSSQEKAPFTLGSLPDFGSHNDRRLSTGSAYSRASQYLQDGMLLGPKRPKPHKIWKKNGLGKTTLIRTLMNTPGERLHDTPGYGDELDTQATIVRMCKFVEDQNTKWLAMEQSKSRKEDLAEVEDPRIDLCLFCIPPH